MSAVRAALRGPALLFCPGSRPERFAKAAAAADTVILDLEDAVAPADKSAARDNAVRALNDWDPTRVIIRINGRGTSWHEDDLVALDAHPDAVVMLPMVARPDDVTALAPRPVIALCETAAGIQAASEIAAAANCVGMMWGSEDLLADLGGRPGRGPGGEYRPVLEHAWVQVLYAARAAGVTPIDTVLVDIADLDLLRADSAAAAASGFAAKACIHPRQIDLVRAAFRPTETETRWAERVLEAGSTNSGAFTVDGRMVDAPVLAHARELIRQSEAARNRQ
jgi:citrate lyase subunit beta/citryl-CoA lyase